MKIAKMSFKNHFWTYNPSTVKLLSNREIVEQKIPMGNNLIQNFGRNSRVVTGEGYLFGEDCFSQYDSLWKVHKEETSGLLTIPKFSVMNSYFTSLEIVGEPKENLISYKFTFVEDMSGIDKTYLPSFCYAESGESLWNISNKYNVDIERLMLLNNQLKNPFDLKVGDKVALC